MNIENEDQPRKLYGYPRGRAKEKVLNCLEKHTMNFIETSPFFQLKANTTDKLISIY